MKTESAAAVLKTLDIELARLRPDLPLAGSPERCLERAAAEDARGGLWVVERHAAAAAARKQEIAAAAAHLAAGLPEVRPWLAFAPGRYVAERDGGAWLVSPFVPGVPLDRPAYAFEGWRGEALAGLLVRFRAAAEAAPGREGAAAFSLPAFVRDLMGKIGERDRPLFERLFPAVLHVERRLFPRLAAVPTAFAHGDFHPLNVIWSETGINGLIDFEFCGYRPETYDAAVLTGCLGMEDPRCLTKELVVTLVRRLRAEAGYADEAWAVFPDLVLALRFAWLSEWLRRDDREMVDLEAVYIGLLLDRRDALERAWA
ncbi:MAG: aminoglycoside phosphotransferase family protein [Candidatus Aminicenantes bacterium]|nr:aminoglycoside phosphotransferase family protein [Candidatus Aminicenantes bacterium]